VTDHILTLNAGSSSLKFALFDAVALTCIAIGQIEGLGVAANMVVKDGAGQSLALPDLPVAGTSLDHAGALRIILAFIGERFPDARVTAVGHRVVHGGSGFDGPVVVTDRVVAQLKALTPFAPLHQPHNLAGIAAAIASFPDVPQIACFDTAFHRGHPFVQDTFALPRYLYDEGVRRYGFHGLSYEYVSQKLAEVSPDHARGKVIVCHLGNGASVCAIQNGRSISSTMGFTPLDGLAMGTRSGQLDPAVVLYLLEQKGMDVAAVSDLLYRESGLKGLSGVSSDMRELEASTDPRASETIDYFTSRIRREIGGLAAVLEGVDAIVFCGGIGENAKAIRAGVLDGLTWLGVDMDPDLNQRSAQIISRSGSSVAAFVIRTNEELMIAQHTRRLVRAQLKILV
jgi:acetate kinase